MLLYLAELFSPQKNKVDYWEKGALAVDNDGIIQAVGAETALAPQYLSAKRVSLEGRAILPGFVDTHVHYPQTYMVGQTGESLLGWLKRYTFPEESKYSDNHYARDAAKLFYQTLLSNGTTASAIFGSSFLSATEILFEEAEKAGVRSAIGKVAMDRGVPKALSCETKQEIKDTESLISRWHGKHNRLSVAITPRFALSCSQKLLTALGELAAKDPSLLVQTHFSETLEEVRQVKKLFPKARDYLSVYETCGLVRKNTVLAHGIHASPKEKARVAKAGASIAHCPTSNLFLGSGLYPLKDWDKAKVRSTLGTDIGGGTSFSMFRTLGEAYKVQQMRGEGVSTARLFHMATLAGAEALGLGKITGSLTAGKAADFQVVNFSSDPLLNERWKRAQSAEEKLSALFFLAESRATQSVFINGKPVYQTK